MILFSDHDYPDTLRLKFSPDKLKVDGKRWTLNNAIFFTGLKIAIDHGIDYMIYLESDCRVGCDNWDASISEESFMVSNPATTLEWGSVVFYSPCNHNAEYQKRWAKMVETANRRRRNYPIPTYGAGGAAETKEPIMLINGALGMYNTRILAELFPEFRTTSKLASSVTAWDFEIGRRAFRKWDLDVFNFIKPLSCIFSSYGNVITTEDDRKDMLRTNSFVAVHQIESEWSGPMDDHKDMPKQIEIPREEEVRAGWFVVSCKQHADWLKYCLNSIAKHAVGFEMTTIAVPNAELEFFCNEFKCGNESIRFIGFDEPDGKGHLAQMMIKCMADECCKDLKLTHIFHIDSDCILACDVSPEEFFVDSKPMSMFEPYWNLINSPRKAWRGITEQALGFPTPNETMCWHPAIYPTWIYKEVRDHIAKRMKMPFCNYVLTRKDDFPYGFCEFNTIGGFAMAVYKDEFHWVDVTRQDGWNNNPKVVAIPERTYNFVAPVIQFWSHQSIDELDKTNQCPEGMSPRAFFKQLGLE